MRDGDLLQAVWLADQVLDVRLPAGQSTEMLGV